MRVLLPSIDRARLRETRTLLLVSLVWAGLCNLTIELLQSGGGMTFALKPVLFALGSLLLWCILVAVWALTGRLRIGAAVLVVVSGVIGFANHTKMELSREPLYPDDFAIAPHAGFLEQMVGWQTLAATLGVTSLVVALTLVVGWQWRRRHPRQRPSSRQATFVALGARIVVAAVGGRRPRARRPVQRVRQPGARRLPRRRRGVGVVVPGEELPPQRLRRGHALQPRRAGDGPS